MSYRIAISRNDISGEYKTAAAVPSFGFHMSGPGLQEYIVITCSVNFSSSLFSEFFFSFWY